MPLVLRAEVRYKPPQEGDIEVFRIRPPQLVQLNVSTWHAGPFFRPEVMDFFNLELRDTNVSHVDILEVWVK